jgi:NAD+--asparagine ADP-ribosyltransferase
MIILEDSEEAINGLAKLIVQEPNMIPELKLIRNSLKENNVLSETAKEEEYFEKTLNIISKAEDIASENLFYIFDIYNTYTGEDGGFMIYKKINHKMVPLERKFEKGFRSTIYSESHLISKINEYRIKNLVTYEPNKDYALYSNEFEDESGEDENEIPPSLDFEQKHSEIESYLIDLLKSNGIKVSVFNEDQVKEFEKDLKLVVKF